MSKLTRKVGSSLAMLRHFNDPLMTILGRVGLVHPAYHSLDIHRNGHSYRLLGRPLGGDYRILREVLVEECYGPLLALLPAKPLRVLDIGAHIGSFMVWLTENSKVVEAYCIEPEPDSFNLCRFNLANKPAVQVNQVAAGGRTRRSSIRIDPGSHARSTIVEEMGRSSNTQTVEIPVVSLAQWLSEHPGTFDLLKLDCEGAEWEILDSCPEVFSQFSVLVAEIHKDPAKGRTRNDFAEAMRGMGYRTVSNDALYFGTRLS